MALDVFIATHPSSAGDMPQRMAHWLASGPPGVYPQPDHWWYMELWRPWGQCEVSGGIGNLLDYVLNVGMEVPLPAVLSVLPGVSGSVPNRRMRVIAGHVPDFREAMRIAAQTPAERRVSPPALTDGRAEDEGSPRM